MTLKQSFPADRLDSLQRMQDNAIVNRHMATVDTRLDRIELAARCDDDMKSVLIEIGYKGARHTFSLYHSPRDVYRAHIDRAPDLQRMIEEIRASDGFETIDPERRFEWGFGRYDGNSDPYLAYVLDTAGPDFADEDSGSTEWSVWFARFGRIILTTDDRGFVSVHAFDTEEACKKEYEAADTAYGEWAEEEEC